jgi:hypothetical protein
MPTPRGGVSATERQSAAADRTPKPAASKPRMDSLKLNERTGNVYENKGSL